MLLRHVLSGNVVQELFGPLPAEQNVLVAPLTAAADGLLAAFIAVADG